MVADSAEHTVVLQISPGELLDERWRVEGRLGQGSMGSVFRGTDLRGGGPVAIKILAPEHCRKPRVLARFEREAEKMTALRHPNLVRFLGHGRRGALPYTVMEYLDGLTLGGLLAREGGALPLAEVLALVRPLSAGLTFLHEHGLVHRDVKPQNVIVGSGGRVTLLDLGVVRDQAKPGLTRPGAMVGTPYYMSPEQILGAEDIDQRTDVYAVAAMTFELLTGHPPFLGDNNFEVLYGHKNLPPPDASKSPAAVPKKVARVLMRGLSKRRGGRPASVAALLEELAAAADVGPVDLARRFADVAHEERTRVLTAPKAAAPRARTRGEVPMAASSDVVSVPGAALGDLEHEQPTTLMSLQDAAPPRTGRLRLVTMAGGALTHARVRVDGVPAGVSPCALTLGAGPHRVRLDLAGYVAVEREVRVPAGRSTTLRVELEPA